MAERAARPEDFPGARPGPERWYRLVPSRHPPAQLWDRVADADELHAVALIEGLTNERLTAELGQPSLVPREDRVFGAGTSPIMAAFCHLNSRGSRFSDGAFGIYYAADSVDAAAAEICYHRRRWYAENRLAPRVDTFRCYVGRVVRTLVDIRDEAAPRPLHDPNSWRAAQAFGALARAGKHWGIRYRSVRARDGECVALLRPPAISPVIQGRHLDLAWDGRDVVIAE